MFSLKLETTEGQNILIMVDKSQEKLKLVKLEVIWQLLNQSNPSGQGDAFLLLWRKCDIPTLHVPALVPLSL